MKNPTAKIVLAALVCTLILVSSAAAVSAQGTLVKAEASSSQPNVGDTLTVTLTISNAQNLFGIDITFEWNPAVLQLVSATPNLGVESHTNGVLHESSQYPIDIIDNNASQETAEYHLLATATGESTPGFSGSGTIATVTFTVKSTGATGLAFDDVELAIKGDVNVVMPSTSVDAVNPAIPEFPAVAVLAVLLAASAATVVAATKIHKKQTRPH